MLTALGCTMLQGMSFGFVASGLWMSVRASARFLFELRPMSDFLLLFTRVEDSTWKSYNGPNQSPCSGTVSFWL